MVVIYNIDDLINVAQDTGNLLKDIALNAGRHYCKIRQKYPNLTRTVPPIQQMWDNFCSNQDISPSPLPYQEFEGGQCSGDLYRVTIARARNGVDRCNFDGLNSTQLFVTGRIIGLRAIATGSQRQSTCQINLPFSERTNYDQYIMYLASEAKPDYDPSSNGIIVFIEYSDTNLFPIGRITNIENLTNPDDLCGNPDIFPPDPIQDPTDFSFSYENSQQTNVGVELNEYEFNFDSNNIDVDVGFNVGVDVILGGKQETNFDIGFGGNEIEINRRGGGSIGGGGATGGGATEPNTQPTTNFEPPGGGGNYEEEEIQDIQDVEPDPTEQNIAFVLIEVVSPPQGDKTILFSDPENNTFFAGYIAWVQIIDGKRYRYPEIPIRKSYNIFEAPPFTKTFRTYAVNRAVLSVKILRQPIN